MTSPGPRFPGNGVEILQSALGSLGLEPAEGCLSALERYSRMLSERGPDLGLISEADRGRVLERHVVDSLRAAAALRPEDRVAYDLGSGAGLPGVVVAIACPALQVTLVESQRRRAAWLELVTAELELANTEVVHGRAEDRPAGVDACFARAFAPLERSWAVAGPLLRSGGRLVYFAGEGSEKPGPLPGAADVALFRPGLLESAGPLVIIRRT